jgi:hypothetical protein
VTLGQRHARRAAARPSSVAPAFSARMRLRTQPGHHRAAPALLGRRVGRDLQHLRVGLAVRSSTPPRSRATAGSLMRFSAAAALPAGDAAVLLGQQLGLLGRRVPARKSA